MKKLIATLLCGVLIVGVFAGCAPQHEVDNGQLNVVATIFPQYDFTRQIAGDKVNLSLLIPPGGESHTYEPTPKDIINIENADLFIYVGGENDTWIDSILTNVNTEKMTRIRLVDCVGVLGEEIVEGMQSREEQGVGEEPDEHVWTSPKNAVEIATVIKNALCEKDSDNQMFYQTNFDAYVIQLKELDTAFATLLSQSKIKQVVFGDRFPFRYFAQEYGLTYYAAFPGCSAESEPSAKTIAFLIDKIRNEQINTIFYIEFSNHKAADTIAQATGAKTALFHSCHNVTVQELAQGATYVSLMTQNLEALRVALSE